MKRPRVCSGDINTRKPKNSQYGTTATLAMIDHQTDLVRDYVEDYCHNIWFLDMLNQLNLYTDENKGKFDLVAAMAMAEVGDEELRDIVPKKVEVVS
jgi:DNA-dependent RNA polymerase auxiliary subunit epsilon